MRLYLASHYDDALLSMPARLCYSAGRQSLSLAVIFSSENEELERVCRGLHRGLGVVDHPLGFEEARRRGLNMRQCLRRFRSAKNLDASQVQPVCQKLLRLVEELHVTELVAPSTMIHIDHALTRAAAESLFLGGQVRKLAYQQDQPYAVLWPESAKVDGTAIVLEQGSVARREVAAILNRLGPQIGTQDRARILANYGNEECGVEPLWVPVSGPDYLSE